METSTRLGRMNAYQIAGLAILCSSVAAITVLVAVRRTVARRTAQNPPTAVPFTTTPAHFTENMIVPGITQTGTEIAEEDAQLGHSEEGV